MAKHPIYSDAARADVRSLDRTTAIRLLEAVSALHLKTISSTSTGSVIGGKPIVKKSVVLTR